MGFIFSSWGGVSSSIVDYRCTRKDRYTLDLTRCTKEPYVRSGEGVQRQLRHLQRVTAAPTTFSGVLVEAFTCKRWLRQCCDLRDDFLTSRGRSYMLQLGCKGTYKQTRYRGRLLTSRYANKLQAASNSPCLPSLFCSNQLILLDLRFDRKLSHALPYSLSLPAPIPSLVPAVPQALSSISSCLPIESKECKNSSRRWPESLTRTITSNAENEIK